MNLEWSEQEQEQEPYTKNRRCVVNLHVFDVGGSRQDLHLFTGFSIS